MVSTDKKKRKEKSLIPSWCTKSFKHTGVLQRLLSLLLQYKQYLSMFHTMSKKAVATHITNLFTGKCYGTTKLKENLNVSRTAYAMAKATMLQKATQASK